MRKTPLIARVVPIGLRIGYRPRRACRQAARTGGAYETMTRLTPKFCEDIREIAELTSDDELLGIAELPEVPVSLEHLRHVDPQTRIVVGYRLDVTPAESPRLRRRLALPPDPGITLFWGSPPI